MLKSIRNKIREAVRASAPGIEGNDPSLTDFIFSYKGQKRIWKYVLKKLHLIQSHNEVPQSNYAVWLASNYPDKKILETFRHEIPGLPLQPLISILLHVRNTSLEHFSRFLDSVNSQVYENWELCISDDHSGNASLLTKMKQAASDNTNIKLTRHNDPVHISGSLNSALELAMGEYVVVMGATGWLAPDALYRFVKTLNDHPAAAVIYGDEDSIINGIHTDPLFKPSWCPDNLLSKNYIGNVIFLSRNLLITSGSFRVGFEGCHLYDMLLRVTECTTHIFNTSNIVYHVINDQETAGLEEGNCMKALEDAILRRRINATVHPNKKLKKGYELCYNIVDPAKVSVIIPSKNRQELCEDAVSSLFSLTRYEDFEVILIDNNSDDPGFFEFIKRWREKEPSRFKYFRDEGEFNFSRLMNKGALLASGKYLLLLNNDTRIIHGDWMTKMVSHAQRESIGAVGVKLLYHNDTIQHAGVVIGLGGIAGHTFVGYNKDAPGYAGLLQSITNYSAVTAACLMIRKNVFEEAGGFDELLPVEFNDVDFCLKVVELGYRNIYIPEVEVYHLESISRGNPLQTPASLAQHVADVKFFEKKWKKYLDNDPCYSPNLSLTITDMFLN